MENTADQVKNHIDQVKELKEKQNYQASVESKEKEAKLNQQQEVDMQIK